MACRACICVCTGLGVRNHAMPSTRPRVPVRVRARGLGEHAPSCVPVRVRVHGLGEPKHEHW